MLNFDFLEQDQEKKDLEKFLHHISSMIFYEKCFWCHIILTDQISLSDCLYFLR